MQPTWTYHLEPCDCAPILDLDPNADLTNTPWLLVIGLTPERYRSEDLRLTLVVRCDADLVWVCRWDRQGREIVVCEREGKVLIRDVIRQLNEVRPQPSLVKEWEASIKRAMSNVSSSSATKHR